MRLRIISVGKKHDQHLAPAIDDYVSRLAHTYAIAWDYVAPSGFSDNQARDDESVRIRARLGSQEAVWLLDERGQQITSPDLADKLEGLKNASTDQLTIIIGGAYGVSDELRKRAQFVWSLSKLVFPHQIVRLLLAEQLYRATQISRGSGYHHQ